MCDISLPVEQTRDTAFAVDGESNPTIMESSQLGYSFIRCKPNESKPLVGQNELQYLDGRGPMGQRVGIS